MRGGEEFGILFLLHTNLPKGGIHHVEKLPHGNVQQLHLKKNAFGCRLVSPNKGKPQKGYQLQMDFPTFNSSHSEAQPIRMEFAIVFTLKMAVQTGSRIQFGVCYRETRKHKAIVLSAQKPLLLQGFRRATRRPEGPKDLVLALPQGPSGAISLASSIAELEVSISSWMT